MIAQTGTVVDHECPLEDDPLYTKQSHFLSSVFKNLLEVHSRWRMGKPLRGLYFSKVGLSANRSLNLPTSDKKAEVATFAMDAEKQGFLQLSTRRLEQFPRAPIAQRKPGA